MTFLTRATCTSVLVRNLLSKIEENYRWTLDEWIEVEMSSHRTAGQRRVPKLLAKVAAANTVMISELSA